MITFPKTKKLQFLSAILLILTISCTLFIFSFSMQNAETSSKVSVGLLRRLLLYLHGFLWFEVEFVTLHHFFRSLAHFVEFSMLGAVATGYFKTIKANIIFPTIYCLLVAITDETIQHITGAGRAAQLKDVLTDFSGSLLAIILFIVIEILIRKIVRIKKEKKEHTTK